MRHVKRPDGSSTQIMSPLMNAQLKLTYIKLLYKTYNICLDFVFTGGLKLKFGFH